MNLVADESVDRQIVERLRQDGHDVFYIAEVEPGVSDDVVLSRANEKNALLVTADKDFGEMVFRQNRLAAAGVMLLRLAGLAAERKADIVSNAFRDRAAELSQAFSVVSHNMIRIRPKE